MRIVYSPLYVVDVGDHVFATRKFGLVAEAFLGRAELVEPEPPTREQLELGHDPLWVETVLSAQMSPRERERAELPNEPALMQAHALAVGGTILACRQALEVGVGLHCGGGAHHAFPAHGEGFCLLNDVAIGPLAMLAEGRVDRAAVIDLDVHHGNGTAAILGGRPEFFTLSIHQDGIYPENRPPSTYDIGLPAGVDDKTYLATLQNALPAVFAFKPDLIVYQAGVDGAEGDLLGGWKLSPEGLRERDRRVADWCRRAGVPVAVTLGGGYSPDVRKTAALHAATLETFAR